MLCATQVHIQDATLAAGVGMGTAAEFMITPYGSLIVGFVCGDNLHIRLPADHCESDRRAGAFEASYAMWERIDLYRFFPCSPSWRSTWRFRTHVASITCTPCPRPGSSRGCHHSGCCQWERLWTRRVSVAPNCFGEIQFWNHTK